MNKQTAAGWADDPIATVSQDQFERAEYAKSAAELIVSSHSWDSSVVFGLTGAWGSGKSSVVSMLSEHIADGYPSWAVAHFTPWAASDMDGLLAEFYRAIGEALPKPKRSAFLRSAAALLRIAAPAATFIPHVGRFVNQSARVAADVAAGILEAQRPWTVQFAETSAKLKELSVPVLVIADDIDRLQADELLTLLKIVRLLGRFGGVQYLLAYDDQTVFRALRTSSLVGTDSRAAEQFMEKIVQYPLLVPPLLEYQQIRRIASGVASAIEGRPPIILTEDEELLEVMRSQLSTPRSIDRFVAQLRHHIPMLPPTEINDGDVIRLTVLRVAFPTVFAKLPQWRDQLITGHTNEVSPGGPLPFARTDVSELVQEVPPGSRGDAEKLLRSLFPKLNDPAISESANERMRMCNKNYFDRYLAMGVPSNDLSNADAAVAVKEAIAGNLTLLENLVSDRDVARAYLALDRVAEVSLDADMHRLAVVKAIEDLLPVLSPATAVDFFSPLSRARILIVDLLGGLSPKVAATDVLASLHSLPLSQQIRIWGRLRGWAPVWHDAVGDALARLAVDGLLENVRAGDEARDDDAIALRAFAMSRPANMPYLIGQVSDAHAANEITSEDLAARFVIQSIDASSPSDEPVLVFERNEWLMVAAPAKLDLQPLRSGEVFDIRDRSWANRGRFARAKAHGEPARPAQPDASV